MILLLAACESGPDYGPWTRPIRETAEDLAANPCQAKAALALAQLYERADQDALAVGVLAEFRARCPADDLLRREAYRIAMDSMQWDAAAEAATPAVLDNPSSARPLIDRAAAWEAKGDALAAISDLRQAFLLDPRSVDPAKRLAAQQEKADQGCKAWDTWGIIWWLSRATRGEAQVARARIADAAGCRKLRASGHAEARHVETPDGLFGFDMLVGDHSAVLGFDSSAPYTVISAALAEKLLLIQEPTPVIMTSAWGTSAGRPVQLPPVRIGEIEVRELDALVMENAPPGIDGIVGINFLTRVDLDHDGEKKWSFDPSGI
ncbi:MAG: clan AA aspartic protease [Deltaproteobacteria bacterium]|nr:clan AA aspartic protease [Deltaproteobacteria bacterium]